MRLDAWFDAGLHRNEDAAAVIEDDRSWTFAEVDALARSWADRILSTTAPSAVAVLAGRNATGYIATLAALRTGATLVPLNPAFPAERTAALLRATGTEILLAHTATDAALIERIRSLQPVRTLPVDARTDLPPADLHSPGRPSPRCAQDAYVLFTSGSSGTPKGVPISHTNVSAFLGAAVRRYPLTPKDRVVQAYDLTFDLGLASLFLAWSQGSAIVPASVFALANPARFVAKHGITIWASVPSVIELATAAGNLTTGCLPGLRLSMFCGEALTTHAAADWAAAAPNSVVENTYGPTELTMFCTAHTWRPELAATYSATVPIGEPFDGTEVRIVDAAGGPADTGELLLRGDQMFRGYLDPRTDDRAFTPESPADRWYRTGDLVTRGPHGLTHLGRLDDQLQVGGHRVEPAEVEHVIRSTLDAPAAVVVQHGTSLVAFVVLPATDDRALTRLARALPPYMCPKHLVPVDDLHRNANGKTDRAHYRALAAGLSRRSATAGRRSSTLTPGRRR